jgi:hypothetical protein
MPDWYTEKGNIMPTKSGIALAMGFFGKLPNQVEWAAAEGRTGPQGIRDFKEDWDRLTEESRNQLTEGLSNGSLTY